MFKPHAMKNQQKGDSTMCKPHSMEKQKREDVWATCNLKKAGKESRKMRATCIVNKTIKIFCKVQVKLRIRIKLVWNGFLNIFGSVKLFQYLLKGLKQSSDKIAPESKPSVSTDMFRFELFGKTFSKKALLFSAPEDGVLFVFY